MVIRLSLARSPSVVVLVLDFSEVSCSGHVVNILSVVNAVNVDNDDLVPRKPGLVVTARRQAHGLVPK